jgi:hypothetical protein
MSVDCGGCAGMEEMIHEEVRQFLDHLRPLAGQPLDVEGQLNLPILNTLCRIAMGDRFEYSDPRLQGKRCYQFLNMYCFFSTDIFQRSRELFREKPVIFTMISQFYNRSLSVNNSIVEPLQFMNIIPNSELKTTLPGCAVLLLPLPPTLLVSAAKYPMAWP